LVGLIVLNFYLYLYYKLYFLLLILAVALIAGHTHTYGNAVDVFSRTFLDDFFLNSYYYYWTNSWFVHTVVLWFILTSSIFYSFYNNKIVFVLMLLFIFILTYDIVDYWYLNTWFLDTLLNQESINILLSNSINKYHPAMFYYSATAVPALYTTLFISYSFWCRLKFGNLFNYLNLLTFKYIKVLVITYTLFLGGWWALQEGSWGGWWNWDPSEVFGMMVMLFLLLTLHSSWSSITKLFFVNNIKLLIFLLTLTYIFIQLNFNLVSHNFGLKSNQILNTAQVLVFFATLFIYLCFRLYIFILRQTSYILTLFRTKGSQARRSWLVKLATLSFIVMELLVSFSPLVNDFLWKTAEVNITFITWPVVLVTVSLSTLVLTLTYSNFVTYLCTYLYLTLLGPHGLIFIVGVIPTYLFFNPPYLLHILLTLFILLVTVSYPLNYVKWELLTGYYNIDILGSVNHLMLKSYSTNLNTLETQMSFMVNTLPRSNYFNFYLHASAPEINSLWLVSTEQFINQSLLGSENVFNLFSITTSLSGLCLQMSLFTIIFILFTYIYRRNLLIIF